MNRWIVALGTLALALGLSAGARAQMTGARGKVVDDEGKPVAGADVLFEFLDGVARTQETTTDENGSYTQTIRGGKWRVTVSKEGYRGAFVEVDVKAVENDNRIPDLELGNRERLQQKRMAPILDKFNKAGELTQKGQLDQAQKLLEELAAEHPEIPEVRFNLGMIHFQREEWDAAEAAFQKALELRPDSVPAAMSLSSVYEKSGRVDEAVALRAKVAEENPADADVLYSLALLYLNLQRLDDARGPLERVAEIQPDKADVQYLLATIALNKGEMAEAVTRLERYLELAPEDGTYVASVQQLLPSLKQAVEQEAQQPE